MTIVFSDSDADYVLDDDVLAYGSPAEIHPASLGGLSVDDYSDLTCFRWGDQYVFFAKDAPLVLINGSLINTSSSNVTGRIYQSNMETYSGYCLTVYPFTQSGFFSQIYNHGSSLTRTRYYYSSSRLQTETSYPGNEGFEVYYLSSRMSVSDVMLFTITFFLGVIMCLFLARFFKR